MFEEYLLTGNDAPLQRLITLMHGNVYNFHELALDYYQAYLNQEAEQVLCIPTIAEELAKASPLTYYYIGHFLMGQGKLKEGKACFEKAEQTNPRCCFPNRLEDIAVLNKAIDLDKDGANAYYYLGCLFYDRFRYEDAAKVWETCVEKDATHGKAWRNLSLYYFDKAGDAVKARTAL
jgi:tetratricopeptide (TPR) repeat protein